MKSPPKLSTSNPGSTERLTRFGVRDMQTGAALI